MSRCSFTSTTCGHFKLRPYCRTSARISHGLFMKNTHFVGQKPQYPHFSFFLLSSPFSFSFHSCPRRALYLQRWKTLITLRDKSLGPVAQSHCESLYTRLSAMQIMHRKISYVNSKIMVYGLMTIYTVCRTS